jgi:hypothetical protein
MKQDISVTRTYSLGNYKNIKFSDTIKDIPKHLTLNREAQDLLRLLQLVSIEKSYFKYVRDFPALHEISVEDALAKLEEFEPEIIRDLKDVIGNGIEVEDKEIE